MHVLNDTNLKQYGFEKECDWWVQELDKNDKFEIELWVNKENKLCLYVNNHESFEKICPKEHVDVVSDECFEYVYFEELEDLEIDDFSFCLEKLLKVITPMINNGDLIFDNM